MSASTLSYTSLEPWFAPLSKPMITQALSSQTATIPVTLDVRQVVSHFADQCASLRDHLLEPRADVFRQVDQALHTATFTTEWMLKSLGEYTPNQTPGKPISAESFSKWRDIGLVRFQERNIPDPDNGAALITLRRLIPKRERGWLPHPPKDAERTNYFGNEPLWWAWRQDSPSSPVIPCPVPLPEDVPSPALLWTDWLGAAWRPDWLKIGTLGCCRWGKTVQVEKNVLWDITEEDLEAWGIPIGKTYKSALKNDLPLTRHMLASSALLILATERLEQAQAFSLASLPLAG